MARPNGRQNNQLREITIETGVSPYAEGSCMIRCGNTHVLCTASVEESVPRFLKGTSRGWITAEYGMLPRATHTRVRREAAQGKQGGRTVEIQRLIGRSLRAAIDLNALGERQIIIDCDVIQADGGTRTASITGGYVALHQAIRSLQDSRRIKTYPLRDYIIGISCGVVNDNVVVDLEYEEDCIAETDANFVMTGSAGLVEVQGTAEGKAFTPQQMTQMMEHALAAALDINKIQKEALGITDSL